MDRVAAWVAGLPQASRNVAAFGPGALMLMCAGLLWALLWRGQWRYWGGALGFAAGIALAAQTNMPDVLIDRDGELAAIRNGSGELVFAVRKKSGFVIETWLRRMGDPRLQADAEKSALRCKTAPCRAIGRTASGTSLTVSLQMPDEPVESACADADIAILQVRSLFGRTCGSALAITFDMLDARGAMAIHVQGDGDGALKFTLAGANDLRANRIWHRP